MKRASRPVQRRNSLAPQSVPTILTPTVLCKSPVPPQINFKNVTPACRVSPQLFDI